MGFKTKEQKNYIEQLTWLRGIAAFFVIVSHTVRATEVKYSSSDEVSNFFFMSLLDLGSFGVVLFFVLSGCTLYISNSERVGIKDITIFYTKRLFRIWPAFIVSLVIFAFFGYIFSALYIEPQGYWIEKQFLSQYSIYDLLSYLTLTFNITGPEELFNNAYWSLPVEFQYYIIFPVIVASLRFGVLGPVILGLILYFLPKFGFINFDENSVFKLAFSFCGGVLVGHIYKRSTFRLNSMLGIFLLVILVSFSAAIASSYIILPDIPIVSGIWNWYGVIAIVTVYVALVTQVNLHNKLENFLKHYGTISYSTYLYHNLFVAIAILFIIHFEIYNSGLRLFVTFSFTLIATYFLATVSYLHIEKPSVELGRSIIKKYYRVN